MYRFINELIHPDKKCSRVGHKTITSDSHWYAKPWKAAKLLGYSPSFRSVAEELISVETKCKRCGLLIDVKWKHIQSIHSFTYSGDDFDKNGIMRGGM